MKFLLSSAELKQQETPGRIGNGKLYNQRTRCSHRGHMLIAGRVTRYFGCSTELCVLQEGGDASRYTTANREMMLVVCNEHPHELARFRSIRAGRGERCPISDSSCEQVELNRRGVGAIIDVHRTYRTNLQPCAARCGPK
jgi:hypothetical protein